MTHSLVHGVPPRGQEIEEGAGKAGQSREMRRKGYWAGRKSGKNSSSLLNSSFDVRCYSKHVCLYTDLILMTL